MATLKTLRNVSLKRSFATLGWGWQRRSLSTFLGICLLAACTPQSTPPTADGGAGDTKVLQLLYWQAPTILNPHLSTGFKDSEASRITLEPLASFDESGTLVPVLAAEVPTLENGGVAADGRSVTWKLRQDVLWSDGTPFTAADVVFTYQFITNPDVGSSSAGEYETVASVEAIADHTVKITFRDVNPAWTLPFVGAEGMILPKHIFEPYNGANAREAPANLMPVGTGPYRVVDFKPGDAAIYEPNPHYREGDRLAFSRIDLKGGGDATAAARAVLQTGDADFADNLQVEPQVLAQLEAGGKGKVVVSFSSLGERIVINQTDPNRENDRGDRSTPDIPHPFLTDTQVRRALNLAIDRDTIARQLYGKTGQPIANFLLLPQEYASPNTSYEFNPDKAAAMLDAAGWTDTNGNGTRDKNGVEMTLLFQTSVNPVRQKTQQVIKQSLERIGVGVELKTVDASIFFSGDPANTETVNRFYADWQMYATGNTSPDPASYMSTYTCDEVATRENDWSGQNYARYCNPEYDALWDASNRELDPEKRRQLFVQMNDLLVNNAVVLPLIHRANVVGVSDRLQGVELTPWDRSTWNIAAWRKEAP